MKSIDFIIESNPALFDLKFEDYQNGKVIYSKPSKYAVEKAENDLKLFEQRQQVIKEHSEVLCGDWVIRKNGSKERITVNSWPDSVQVGGSQNGSFYIHKSGGCSYSGGCGDVIERKNLRLTGEYLTGLCWIFSQDWSGAHRGVYNELEFKVWEEI